MLDLFKLEQLLAFADYGTLSRAAEELHISQPTITRTMQQVEEAFGVALFVRGKNKIALNATGLKAVEYARNLLSAAENAVRQVKAYDKGLHTITVQSCAPAPLWSLLPMLSAEFPDMTISAGLSELADIIRQVCDGSCEIGILPYCIALDGMDCQPIVREELSVCLPKGHELANCTSLTFDALNGYNCLLKSEIGFWDEMCRQKMPASRFLVQKDDFEFWELVRESSLICFTTNLADGADDLLQRRNIIPILDPEANVTYHLLYPAQKKEYGAIANKLHTRW